MSTPTPAELAELRAELERTAPPGFRVVDLWACNNGHCEDVHALVLPVDQVERAAPAKRRARRSGRRRG